MKKITVLAMLAAVLMVAPAFAVTRHLTPAPNATFAVGAAGVAAGPATTNNDDSCDIGTAPAATLLLPYFDVDIKDSESIAHTTLFTVTNVSNLPQIAHCTVWTDWSFPVLDFNIYLTGYDVQSINLYDILNGGIIAPSSGTSDLTVSPANPTAGSQPACATTPGGCATGALLPINLATTNPNINSFTGCSNLPGPIPPTLLSCVQSALTTGVDTCTCASGFVGGTHTDAIGYITVDVNANCNTSLPNQPTYFTTNILFDNVLIGDYEQVNPNSATGNYAGGNPMVSIRAVPEGGSAGSYSTPASNLPDTFYDRYTQSVGIPDRRIDRRQPLPSLFAARYIEGGTGAFNTSYEIWREGITTGQCAGTINAASSNSALGISEIVRFDEHENATTVSPTTVISPAPLITLSLPETSSTPVSGSLFPAMPSAAGDVAGWMYLNLHNGGPSGTIAANYSRDNVAPPATTFRASQNWVSVDMYAQGRYEALFDAAWLGNGCSPPAVIGAQIGPAGGVLVCPPTLTTGTCNQPPVGTNITPP